ncbi:hypothetical protein [Paenisporosarcina quisquiliarum]|nr:hypothetical protein [Paenisporosarcina quisquiliarum]
MVVIIGGHVGIIGGDVGKIGVDVGIFDGHVVMAFLLVSRI